MFGFPRGPGILLALFFSQAVAFAQTSSSTDPRWLTPQESGSVITLGPAPVVMRKVVYSPPVPVVKRDRYCDEAVLIAAKRAIRDDAPNGWCGRGVFNVLTTLGVGDGLESANGQDWGDVLRKNGWTPKRCSSPFDAPHMSVLIYDSDKRLLGRNVRGTPGGNYGHVELVLISSLGERWYIADDVRFKPGGSVLDNFTGVAWVPPRR